MGTIDVNNVAYLLILSIILVRSDFIDSQEISRLSHLLQSTVKLTSNIHTSLAEDPIDVQTQLQELYDNELNAAYVFASSSQGEKSHGATFVAGQQWGDCVVSIATHPTDPREPLTPDTRCELSMDRNVIYRFVKFDHFLPQEYYRCRPHYPSHFIGTFGLLSLIECSAAQFSILDTINRTEKIQSNGTIDFHNRLNASTGGESLDVTVTILSDEFFKVQQSNVSEVSVNQFIPSRISFETSSEEKMTVEFVDFEQKRSRWQSGFIASLPASYGCEAAIMKRDRLPILLSNQFKMMVKPLNLLVIYDGATRILRTDDHNSTTIGDGVSGIRYSLTGPNDCLSEQVTTRHHYITIASVLGFDQDTPSIGKAVIRGIECHAYEKKIADVPIWLRIMIKLPGALKVDHYLVIYQSISTYTIQQMNIITVVYQEGRVVNRSQFEFEIDQFEWSLDGVDTARLFEVKKCLAPPEKNISIQIQLNSPEFDLKALEHDMIRDKLLIGAIANTMTLPRTLISGFRSEIYNKRVDIYFNLHEFPYFSMHTSKLDTTMEIPQELRSMIKRTAQQCAEMVTNRLNVNQYIECVDDRICLLKTHHNHWMTIDGIDVTDQMPITTLNTELTCDVVQIDRYYGPSDEMSRAKLYPIDQLQTNIKSFEGKLMFFYAPLYSAEDGTFLSNVLLRSRLDKISIDPEYQQ